MTQIPDTIASPNETTYESLISLIENSQEQLALIIVACDDLRLRQQTIERYEREANQEQIRAERIVLGTEPSLRAGLARLELPPAARVVVTVTGAEWLLRVKTRSADEQSDLDKFFGYLQWTREGLREFRHPIVLWVTFPILREMSRKAPDFWSWRKAVLRFTSAASEPIIPVVQEHVSARSFDRQNDDFLPPPAEIRSEIHQLEANNPASANLATLYQKLAEVYAARIASGEATNLEQEQQQAIEAFEKAIELYRELNDRSALANISNNFGNFLFARSQYENAIDFYQQSLIMAHELFNRNGEGSSLYSLGSAYEALGEYQIAIDFYQQSLGIAHELAHDVGESLSICGIGNAYKFLGEYQKSIDFYQQSLEIWRKIGDRESESNSLNDIGNIYYLRREYQRAIIFYEQSLEIDRETKNRNGEAYSLNNLANAYNSMGEDLKAIDLYQQSLEIKQETGNSYGVANTIGNIGNIYSSLKQYERAIDFHQQSLEIQREIKDFIGEANSLGNLANVYDVLKKHKPAIDLYQQSLEIRHRIGDRRGEAQSLFNLALSLSKDEFCRFEAFDKFKQARVIYADLKLDEDVEKCDEAIYNFNQIIATVESQSVPTINN